MGTMKMKFSIIYAKLNNTNALIKLSYSLARYALYTMRCRATLEPAEITEKISLV